MESTLPEQLGIWRLGSNVREGASFCVCFAQPVDAVGSPRWDYAMKVATSPDGRTGIASSIAAGAVIRHPNVVPVLDGNASGEWPYVAMPLLDGRTMKWHLASGPRKPLPVALWLIRQICQGLAAMHAAGWTHGDVKPDNVIVGSNGHVTLIDLAFAHQGTMDPSAPFRGTRKYAAPELLVNASAGTPASDLFAAGRMLWEWLARVETSNEQVLSPVCELVECMVDEAPENRPSADEVTATLLRMEIDTLGEHIVPTVQRRAA
ncbi:protein kinase domain-containing protein [Rhodopirellula sp. JC639]|uniref:protein kinase domain-containing protein n=1 Tax=Stieleria mannarensis TaxID=2755585 RepID=UPI0015FEC5C1|nr:protein kinase [Rhodopirellula sp. JC639]